MSTDPRREPSADARTLGAVLRNQFVAFVQEGFTEDQALRLLGYMLAANTERPQ